MIDLLKSKGIGSFWARGRLSSLEQSCLASFVNNGYSVTLFSYGEIYNIPAGVHAADANTIVPESMVARVRHNGRPDLAHFSDLFRYEMIKKRDLVWMDADLLMISDRSVAEFRNIIVREEQGGINNALLYVSDKALMDTVSEAMSTKLDKDLKWGETGPQIMSDAVQRDDRQIDTYEHRYFYPIEHYDIWKILLPAHADECRVKCADAATLHMFNNILTTMGYWKDIAPPKGSFLYEKLADRDLLGFFREVYPDRVMQACVDNFRFRQNGKALGLRTVIRQIIPSASRTYQHYRKHS
jgi:hypothetical protein